MSDRTLEFRRRLLNTPEGRVADGYSFTQDEWEALSEELREDFVQFGRFALGRMDAERRLKDARDAHLASVIWRAKEELIVREIEGTHV